MKRYHVYILECSDGSFYTGITSNLTQRMEQHSQDYFKQCYTRKRRPLILKYFLEFDNVVKAIQFEKQVKGWSRAKKVALINGDFDTIQLLSECRNFRHFKYKP